MIKPINLGGMNLKTKILVWGFFILAFLYLDNKFFEYYQLQLPIIIKIQSPIERRMVNPLPKKPSKAVVEPLPTTTPTPTEKPHLRSEREIILSQTHGKELLKIYQLETSSGKNDYCRLHKKGYGGFGVMYKKKIVCYPTFEKAVERAEYWLTKFGVDDNLAKALCLWNVGKAVNNCRYYQSYMSL